MKWSFLWLLVNLFLERYPITIVSCEDGIQIEYLEQLQTLELFNVSIVDVSDTCRLLLEADVVEIELEPNIQQDQTISAWVFVDGELLQQKLVEKELASVTRQNPTYAYQLQEETEVVSGFLQTPIEVNQKKGYVILGVMFILTIFFVILHKTVKY